MQGVNSYTSRPTETVWAVADGGWWYRAFTATATRDGPSPASRGGLVAGLHRCERQADAGVGLVLGLPAADGARATVCTGGGRPVGRLQR